MDYSPSEWDARPAGLVISRWKPTHDISENRHSHKYVPGKARHSMGKHSEEVVDACVREMGFDADDIYFRSMQVGAKYGVSPSTVRKWVYKAREGTL